MPAGNLVEPVDDRAQGAFGCSMEGLVGDAVAAVEGKVAADLS